MGAILGCTPSEKSDLGRFKTPTGPKAGNILGAQVSEEQIVRQADAMRAAIDSMALFRDPGLITSGLGLIYRIEDAANRRCEAATKPNGYPHGEDIPKR